MKQSTGWIQKKALFLLNNKNQALWYVGVLSTLSFTDWLATAIVSLYILRKGIKEQTSILLAVVAITTHILFNLISLPLHAAIMNSTINFIPCFIGAIILRNFVSWRLVSVAMVLQVLLVIVLLQYFLPDEVTFYLDQAKELAQRFSANVDLQIFDVNSSIKIKDLFIGTFATSTICFASLPLMMARSIQSKLFYPGGFRQEMVSFRGGKLDILVLLAVIFSGYLGNSLAISFLPAMLAYFMLIGLSLGFSYVSYFLEKKRIHAFYILLIPIVLMPIFALFGYVMVGSLDCIFKFKRPYIQIKTS